MFTGIIENQAEILQVSDHKLLISNPFFKTPLTLGQSISVNGCCLTVIRSTPKEIEFDVSPETLDRTSFQKAKIGDFVNLERGIKAGDPLDGHWVTGHIDATGVVQTVVEDAQEMKTISFQIPSRFSAWVIEKGSISINGVSLTINKVLSNGFEVMLIPHTLKMTNLRNLTRGDVVNLEFDILAKYIERMLSLKEART